jgi:two-component system, NarL family, nitrate/nitrite response regulator NarL
VFSAEITGIKLVVVDPQSLVREALSALLNGAEGIDVVDAVGAAPELIAALKKTRADLVLFRFDPASSESAALLHELPRVVEYSRVIVLTASTDVAVHTRAVELGAMGVLSCDETGAVLVKAIRKVHAGELWLDRARTAGIVTQLARGVHKDPDTVKIESLTTRQREIVTLVAEGLTNRQLADRLFISEATVRNHITAILDKLELRDRFQLAVYAFRQGLVTYPQKFSHVLPISQART